MPDKRRVLVIDDDEAFRLSLVTVLDSDEMRPTACGSGEEAIELLAREKFDVVLLDYKMPGMNGLNVLQWMHEQKIETPVVMLTAAGSEYVAVEAMKLGAYDYVRKEMVDIEHLPVTINGVYERYLFRKEKQRREEEEREREKNAAAIKMFGETVVSIGHYVNNALAVLSMNLTEHERDLTMYVPEAQREKFREAFGELRQEFSIVAAGVRSMLNLSSLVTQRVNDREKAALAKEEILDKELLSSAEKNHGASGSTQEKITITNSAIHPPNTNRR
jgi:DNA-binding response OmpR family regulator